MTSEPLFVGIDVGTSGCRACAIDEAGAVVGSAVIALSEEDAEHPETWWQAVLGVLHELLSSIDSPRVAAIAVDGTSGTVLLTDGDGQPLTSPLMYSDTRACDEAAAIACCAPSASAALGSTSSLAKLLWLQKLVPAKRARHALHQADWIMGRLCGRYGISDENNCLKLGYDPVARMWPEWLKALNVDLRLLPEVHPPGTPVGAVHTDLCTALKLPSGATIVTGTTDSIAGFIATGAARVGDAVTSLGSTLVLKVVADQPIYAPEFGVYSHRLGDLWLAGGASNSGGAVLRKFFSQVELDAMTPRLEPENPTGLDYYPLPGRGERFPRYNPSLPPRLEPRPDDPLRFFQGILEGIAAVERLGYRRLQALGAPYPGNVRTVGGGARNAAWMRIRERLLGVKVTAPVHTDAAYGAALLARSGVLSIAMAER